MLDILPGICLADSPGLAMNAAWSGSCTRAQEEFTRQQLEIEARLDDDDYSRRHEATKLTQALAVKELEYAKKVR